MNKEYTMTFTGDELLLILQQLGELSYNKVIPIFRKVEKQMTAPAASDTSAEPKFNMAEKIG